ncbi:MAG: ROK family protein [Fuscovulum sp.]|jgi:N-acetylglucosamine kinase|nr:ROK family protein [Fuscovulum sp.]
MILAFDIGGSRIRAALWDGTALQPMGEAATPAGDLGAFTATIAAIAETSGAVGMAISIAGVVDPVSGIGKVANIPAIDGLALGPALQAATDLPVLVLNDADCFALAEARLGAGRGHPNVFGVILGTGVGGGLVIDGRIVTGAGGYAGEWGHGPVIRGQHAFPCGCGQVGCVDVIGGARGLERLHLHSAGHARTSEQIIADWHAGDPAARATLELWRDLVSGPLAMVLNVVGASVVPVGGGLSRAAGLVEYLDQALRARILRQTAGALAVPAQCGADAGLLGAALAGAAAWL